jgi:hypothetical protein
VTTCQSAAGSCRTLSARGQRRVCWSSRCPGLRGPSSGCLEHRRSRSSTRRPTRPARGCARARRHHVVGVDVDHHRSGTARWWLGCRRRCLTCLFFSMIRYMLESSTGSCPRSAGWRRSAAEPCRPTKARFTTASTGGRCGVGLLGDLLRRARASPVMSKATSVFANRRRVNSRFPGQSGDLGPLGRRTADLLAGQHPSRRRRNSVICAEHRPFHRYAPLPPSPAEYAAWCAVNDRASRGR